MRPVFVVGIFLASCAHAYAPAPPRRTIEGAPAPARFAAFDLRFERLLAEHRVPGCSVAVASGGRIAYEQGYGRAGPGPDAPMTPSTRLRIASLSKAVTAVAVHLLVERGRLSLEDAALPLVGFPLPLDDPRIDPRWRAIRVRHLLEHSAGFDRDRSFDPMFDNLWLARELGVPSPLGLDGILAAMATRPLDFDPGSEFAYSNFGYALLGRILEHVTGEPYGAWVQREVLEPAGVRNMELGRSLPRERPPDEAWYFADPGEATMPNLFTLDHEPVASPDGGFAIEAMAAHGGFIATASDYARFLLAVDGRPDPPDLLGEASMQALLSRPGVPRFGGADFYPAHGFWVEELPDGGRIWHHTGSKPGTSTFALRNQKGLVYVALCNGRPLGEDFHDAIDGAFLDALATLDEGALR